MDEIKASFRKCMSALYPDGLDVIRNRLQLRDLARTFVMGWVEALATVESHIPPPQGLSESLDEISELDWLPDTSWMWWNEPSLN